VAGDWALRLARRASLRLFFAGAAMAAALQVALLAFIAVQGRKGRVRKADAPQRVPAPQVPAPQVPAACSGTGASTSTCSTPLTDHSPALWSVQACQQPLPSSSMRPGAWVIARWAALMWAGVGGLAPPTASGQGCLMGSGTATAPCSSSATAVTTAWVHGCRMHGCEVHAHLVEVSGLWVIPPT